MNLGKVSESVLERSVFKQFTVKRDEVLTGPGVGEDCSLVELAENEVFVISSDPITATATDIGKLSVHITVNDLAASGAEPVGLMLTILLPPETSEKELNRIIKDVNIECEKLNIAILGGHTEVTAAVNQPIISVAGVGKIEKAKQLGREKIKPNQSIIMTKWAGLEGTTIIAAEKEKELKKQFNASFVDQGIAMNQYLSVLEESRIAMKVGVSLMHDVTEGGIFGALWEIAASGSTGIEVYLDRIPLRQETIEICEYFDLNPYKLISSGSMLMVTDKGVELERELNDAGIPAVIIGETKEGNDKIVIQSDTERALQPPKADELYKVI